MKMTNANLDMIYDFIVNDMTCGQISKNTNLKTSVVYSRATRTISAVWVNCSLCVDGRYSPPQSTLTSARKNREEWAEAIERARSLTVD